MGSIIKKLNRIHVEINSKYNQPFPKPRIFWLSEYTYQRRYIKINPDGRIAGGLSRFVSSLIDFSFIRSIVAHTYKPLGFAYDPVSLFLLELFRYLEKYPDMKTFVQILRDREKGKHYRLYAGIKYPHLPCEGTFTHLKDRLENNYITRSSMSLWRLQSYWVSYRIRSFPPMALFSPPMPGTKAAPISVRSVSSSSSKASSITSGRGSFTASLILPESLSTRKFASR